MSLYKNTTLALTYKLTWENKGKHKSIHTCSGKKATLGVCKTGKQKWQRGSSRTYQFSSD